MCDCITTVEKLIREQSGDDKATLDVGFTINRETMELSARPSGLGAHYRKKKQDGTFAIKSTFTPVTPTFCPFCGIEYAKAKEAPHV